MAAPAVPNGVLDKPNDNTAPRAPGAEDITAVISMLPNIVGIHTCDSCTKDIGAYCYIRCAECINQPHGVDLCVECFAEGKEPMEHKKTHKYRVMDKLSEKVFTEDWTAAEELCLLDHVKKNGLGAWEDMSEEKVFYRHKLASDICAHYLDTYLCRYGSVLPPFYLNHREDGTVERVPVPPTGPDPHDPRLRGVQVKSREIRSRTIAELGTEPQFRYEPSWQALEKKKGVKETEKAKRAAASAGGGRGGTLANGAAGGGSSSNGAAGGGDVDGADASHADSEATAIVNASEPKGSAQSRKRKRKAQQTSRNKEEERQIKEWVDSLPGADLGGYFPLRGDFEVEHDNTAEELLANMEFRATDHPSERQLKLDVIAVYNHRLDERERRKRFVVEHNLLDYKKPLAAANGKKRLKEDRELMARLRPFARFHSMEEHEELIDNLLLAKKMRARIEQLQTYRENGITTLAEGQEFEMRKKRRTEELASKKHREGASYLYDAAGGGKGTKRDRSHRYTNRHKDGGSGGEGDGSSEDGVAAKGGGDLMDLNKVPGVEYLSASERGLCSELHILPGYYLVVKDAMIQECARSGFLKRKSLTGLAVMDSDRLDRMYDFFVTCGWVSEHMQDLTYHATPSAAAQANSLL